MQHNILLVGRQFRDDMLLQRYALRHIKSALHRVDSLHFFDENDKRLFLQLERLMNESGKLVVVTSKSSFVLIGKLLSTLTSDSQILKESMLIPSQTNVYSENSYLLEFKHMQVNVLSMNAGEEAPKLLLDEEHKRALIHIFDVNIEDVNIFLTPLAQMYDVTFNSALFIDGWVHVTLDAKRYGEIKKFIVAVKGLLNQKVIASTNVIAYIIDKLHQNNKKITFAESCTGGLLATMFTKQSGASLVFDGSVVSYSNAIKENWLGVDDALLKEYGAVSEKVVLAMSKGAREVASSDFALAVSGIAGPTGGVEGKPVGTVYISASTTLYHKAFRLQLKGDREYIQHQSAFYAIKLLLLSDTALFFTNR